MQATKPKLQSWLTCDAGITLLSTEQLADLHRYACKYLSVVLYSLLRLLVTTCTLEVSVVRFFPSDGAHPWKTRTVARMAAPTSSIPVTVVADSTGNGPRSQGGSGRGYHGGGW